MDCERCRNVVGSSNQFTTIIFDAIAGDIAGKFLSLMPNGSTLYNYGGLSGKPVGGFTGAEFIFQGKSVSGLWLGPYVMGLNPVE